MSKNSHKALYEQLRQWLPTAIKKRDKRVKSNNNGQQRMQRR